MKVLPDWFIVPNVSGFIMILVEVCLSDSPCSCTVKGQKFIRFNSFNNAAVMIVHTPTV